MLLRRVVAIAGTAATLLAGCGGPRLLVTLDVEGGVTTPPTFARLTIEHAGGVATAETGMRSGPALDLRAEVRIDADALEPGDLRVCAVSWDGTGASSSAAPACGCVPAVLEAHGATRVTVPLRAVTPPTPGRPAEGAPVGSVHAPESLRPAFSWRSNGDPERCAGLYELEYGEGVPDTLVAIEQTTYTPTEDVTVPTSPPVGARFAWHVRACVEAGACTAWSLMRHFDLGRSAHDLDGDGWADLVAGAPGHAGALGADQGAVHFYFGGAAFDGVVDLTLEGAAPGERLGAALAFAGDVNGDGYGDLLVAAPGHDEAGLADVGAVRLYAGGARALVGDAPSLTLIGASPGARMGTAVAGAGDFDADGYADFAISEPGGGSGIVIVSLYFGGAAVDATADLALMGTGADGFGAVVAGLGDFDGDAFADVAVGAPAADRAGRTDAGVVYVYGGGEGLSLDAVVDLEIGGAADQDALGSAVASAGDFNGDGVGDVIVGGPGAIGGAGAGVAYLHLGAATLDAVPDVVLWPVAMAPAPPGARFGASVMGAGDFDGDGRDDVVVGAPGWDGDPSDGIAGAGRALLFLGESSPTTSRSADAEMCGGAPSEELGVALAGGGDLDGDGRGDVAAGAPCLACTAPPAQSVRVWLGANMPGACSEDLAIASEAGDVEFGAALAH